MANKYLGPSFDIHGGGLDLIFPHHENEIAQSRCAGGDFAHYWVHNGLVTTAGEKMSKSLGNSMLVRHVVQQVRPIELRYYLASAHYRSVIEFSFTALQENATAFQRIEGFLLRAAAELGIVKVEVLPDARPTAFDVAMDDDLGVPEALAVVHETVTRGNAALATAAIDTARAAFDAVVAMTDALGVNPYAPQWPDGGADVSQQLHDAVDKLVAHLLEQRAAARVAKDFAAADVIRDHLADAGIAVVDHPTGTRWTLADGDS